MEDTNKYSWSHVIEAMHLDIIEALKTSKPGTPEWVFCMTSLHAYESWYLNRENEDCGFNKNDTNQ